MTGQQLIDAVALGESELGFVRCRDAKWANPDAYLRLAVLVIDGQRNIGPWAHLYDRATQEAIGEPTPQAFVTFMAPFNMSAFLTQDYDPWTGALDPADENR